MTSCLLRLAIEAVRAWTRIYTWRLPPELRDARRAEVESDLWEGVHDPEAERRTNAAVHVLARGLIGVPDDLGWRIEQENIMATRLKWGFGLTALVAGLLTFWVLGASRHSPAPSPPDPPRSVRAGIGYLPPPQPPPPPPPSPGGESRPDQQHLYGLTSYTVVGSLKPPVKIKDVRPVYPPIAVTYNLRGVVILEATVDERGRVIETRTLRSIPVLDQSVVNAVRQWEFQPTVVDAVPVRVRITVTATFET